MKHILIVDDELGARESLKTVFSKDYQISIAQSADEASKVLSGNRIDLVLLDIIMPEKDGVTFLKEIRDLYPNTIVIMVSASASIRPAIDAIRLGAYDYISKPFDVTEVRRLVERAFQDNTLQRRVEVLQSDVLRDFPVQDIVGGSPIFKKAIDDVRKAAETTSTVLISGESGTGKELAARLLHALSNRRDEPFVAVHCASLPETLMESELFGHEKGAFEGAHERKLGRFDLVGSGTLFFDEVSEMSLPLQSKLLRVLEEHEYMRVGGTHPIRTNVRIVAATAKDLRTEIKEKKFRDDFYYRLSVVPVYLPSLKERPEDIPVLARHFLSCFKKNFPGAICDFDPETLDILCSYPWPGNVRELRNMIERLVVLHGKSGRIHPKLLPPEFHNQILRPNIKKDGLTLTEAVNIYERSMIEKALDEAAGVQTRAAELLGTTRRILKYRMDKLNITDPRSG